MDIKDDVPATGTVIGRHDGRRGRMISIAMTLPEHIWYRLAGSYAERWKEAEDDFDMRELTLEERIALFVIDTSDRWCDPMFAVTSRNGPDDSEPF